jgi:hypothetical protein
MKFVKGRPNALGQNREMCIKPMSAFPKANIMCGFTFEWLEAAQSGLRLMASTMLRHLTMSDRNIVSAAF